MTDRLLGSILFLPVPIVLWLFTRAPLGVPLSLALGTLVMATHRRYARPWARLRAGRRCLWCGAATEGGVPVAIEEPLGHTTWRACGDAHAGKLARVLRFAERWSAGLRIAIFGGLAVFLPAALLAATGNLGLLTYGDAVAFFKLLVAIGVLPLGWLGPFSRPFASRPIRVPFPVHIQALIGTWAVLWLFRVVGLVWLVQAALHVARRL
ncbi:MAG: hypothetical protein ACM3O7_05495 [Acidobacteriota bacterium]